MISASRGKRNPPTPEQAERHRQRNRIANMTPEQTESARARRQVANMSQEQVESARARRQVANMSQEQVESARARRQAANMSQEQVESAGARRQVANMSREQAESERERGRARRRAANEQAESARARRQVANMSQEQAESLRARRQVANMSPLQIDRRRAIRTNSRSTVPVLPVATAIIGYYGNGEEGAMIADEDDLPNNGEAQLPETTASDQSKEVYDMKKYIKFLDKGSDLRICFVCHEEHNAIIIGDKVYAPNDRMFDCLRPTPHASPVFAFDLVFAERADIPLRVCKKCSASPKRGRVPPRSVNKFHVLDDEKFMKFFRNLDRIQARLIAKVIPIVTINIQKVYGDTNTVMHAKTTNNTISLKAATSKVIEQTLPRSLSDIGMIHFRSRSKKLINADINHQYKNIAVDPIQVLHALGVLTGSAEGMLHPLNAHYRPRDSSEEHIANRLAEFNGLFKSIQCCG
jgi:hypothetical protein